MEQKERPRRPYVFIVGAEGLSKPTKENLVAFVTGMDVGMRLGLEHPKEAMEMLMELDAIKKTAGVTISEAPGAVNETVAGWYEHVARSA